MALAHFHLNSWKAVNSELPTCCFRRSDAFRVVMQRTREPFQEGENRRGQEFHPTTRHQDNVVCIVDPSVKTIMYRV